MTFERTHDMGLVRRIATDPVIYRAAADDYAPQVAEWGPVDNDRIWYVLVKDSEGVIGIFVFTLKSHILWDVHICILPQAWGARAKMAARGMLAWIWSNTTCLRLIAEIPGYNRHAIAFAKSVGMEEYGCNPEAFMKEGRLHSLVMLGVSKPCQ